MLWFYVYKTTTILKFSSPYTSCSQYFRTTTYFLAPPLPNRGLLSSFCADPLKSSVASSTSSSNPFPGLILILSPNLVWVGLLAKLLGPRWCGLWWSPFGAGDLERPLLLLWALRVWRRLSPVERRRGGANSDSDSLLAILLLTSLRPVGDLELGARSWASTTGLALEKRRLAERSLST